MNKFITNLKTLIYSQKVEDYINKTLTTRLQDNSNCDNLYSCFDIQAKLINLQLFAGSYEIDISYINLNELYNDFEKVVVDTIQKLYHPSNKKEFINIVCNNYLTNGYMCHGTSKIHYANIKKNGLNGNNNFKNVNLLTETDSIFLSHNKHKCFEGKINVLSTDSYYVSDNIYSGIYYSYQSPEYLSRFCANGHITKGNRYDTFAYFRRDKKTCYENLETFCNLNHFTVAEKQKTLKCFKKLWKQNVAHNEQFYLCFVPRKIIDRTDSGLVKDLLKSNLTKKEIIKELLIPKHIHDQIFTPVAASDILFLPLLNLHKKFNNISKGTKYITRKNKEYIYDIVLDVPNKSRVFYCFNTEHSCKISDDLYAISKDDFETAIKENQDCFANECSANTTLGEEIISLARDFTSLQNLKLKLTNKAKQDLEKCKRLKQKDTIKCYGFLHDILIDYLVILKVIVDNNNWYSNLDTGTYSTACKELDPHYSFLHSYNSKNYDKTLLSQRLNNITKFINSINL